MIMLAFSTILKNSWDFSTLLTLILSCVFAFPFEKIMKNIFYISFKDWHMLEQELWEAQVHTGDK